MVNTIQKKRLLFFRLEVNFIGRLLRILFLQITWMRYTLQPKRGQQIYVLH